MKKHTKLICIILTAVLLFICSGCASKEVTGTLAPISEDETAVETPPDNEENTEDILNVVSEDIAPAPDTADAPDSTDETDEIETSEDEPAQLIPSVSTKGIYITGPTAGSERMNELIELVETTELNTMVIDVKNDEGNLTYKMELPEQYDFDAGIRYIKDIKELNLRLHEDDIYTIGRIVCFKDPILASTNPDLALCLPDGRPVTDANGLSWVNPYKEEVWDYLCTIAECAIRDGFDEIQFDYIRFPIGEDANAADYGVDMNDYTREEGLSDFFAYITQRLHAQNIIFGADLFGTVIGSDVDRDRTGQSYPALVQMADVVCPMIYPSHYASGTFGLSIPDANPYETISQALALSQEELSSLDQKAVIRPWLQCFNAVWVPGHITYDSAAVYQQIQAVYDAGYDEWLLWNASNHYEQVAEALSMFQNSDNTNAGE